jgi:dolichol-phosphate mannosyltransferase
MSFQLMGDLRGTTDVGVILPTYREAENIANLIGDIESLPIETSILVIDDSSPDGTAEIVKKLQKKHGNILLCVRPEKRGLGSAITDGFKIFLSLKFPPRFIITMDADYSHNPKAIPQLLSNMRSDCGLVVGSRYCGGGEIAGWSWTRKIISHTANVVARLLVGLKLGDCTSGFRCYSATFVRAAIGSLHSQTYEIQIETLRQAISRDFRVKETPILFVNRKQGKSKLSLTEIQSYISYVFKAAMRGRNKL